MMRIAVACAKAVMGLVYFFFKLLPVKNKVVLISRQSDSPSLDFRLVKHHLKLKYPELDVVMLCHTLNGKLEAGAGELVRYCMHMFKQLYHIATSKVVVLDSYCIVVSLFKHRKNLQVIQMWHSMGSMKNFGYTALDTEEGVSSKAAYLLHMHENYTCVFASSHEYIDDLAAGFNCSRDIIRIMPLPRTDLLRGSMYKKRQRKIILEKYPSWSDKKVILYCPTFRSDETKMAKALQDLAALIDEKNEILVCNPHPLSKLTIDFPGVVYNTMFTSFDLLSAADVMITDYSCMAYEAAFCEIPVYFYDFDKDEYVKERGLAVDYDAVIPVPADRNAADLMERIRHGSYDKEKLKQFSDKYIEYSGHAGSDIADCILKIIKK